MSLPLPPIHPDHAREIVALLASKCRDIVGRRNMDLGYITDMLRYQLSLILLLYVRDRAIDERYWEAATEITCVEDPPESGYVTIKFPPILHDALGDTLNQVRPLDDSPTENWRIEGESRLFEDDG